MFKLKISESDILLIIVNLIPIYGVWFEGWDPKQMFLVYCLESIILGCFNVIKMAIVTFVKKKENWETGDKPIAKVNGIFFILFFMVHYGMFVFIQTSIFAGVSGLDQTTHGPFSFFIHIPYLLSPEAQLMLLIFIGAYGLRMMMDFILSGTYKTISLGELMFQPYGRILIQQVVVIFGSMFLAFGAAKVFMLIFIAVKLFFDLFIHLEKYTAKATALIPLKNKGEAN